MNKRVWRYTGSFPQDQGRPRQNYSLRRAMQTTSINKHHQYRLTKWRGKACKILPCLKCGQAFRSLGLGNRLCDRCRKENAKIDWGYARLIS